MMRTILICFFALYACAARAENVVVTVVQPAAVASAISFVGTATSSSFTATQSPTINYPAAVANDIWIMAVATDNEHDANGTPPTGWTKLDQQTSGTTDSTTSTYWRRATGSEGATEAWTTIFAAIETGVAQIVVYRGCVTTGSPINASAAAAATTSTAWTASVTSTADNSMIVAVFGTDHSSGVSFEWTAPATERDETGAAGTTGYLTFGDRLGTTQTEYTLAGTISSTDSYAYAIYALTPQ